MHPNGTIVRKAFNRGHFEGEITNHDPKEDFYRIRYSDGDTEEMTYMEVQQYKKPLQRYSPKHQAERHTLSNAIQALRLSKLNQSLHRLQTKRLCSPSQSARGIQPLRTHQTTGAKHQALIIKVL